MPHITTDDGVKLYYEEVGTGVPILFVHEFAGDYRSYEAQLRHFCRRYRCVAYNARGYPPSDVPPGVEQYSQARARDDVLAIITSLGLEQPFIVGISMGGFATLHFGIEYGERARGLVIGGCGYGAEPARRNEFQAAAEAAAARFETLAIESAATAYALGATRVQLQNKDPRGWAEFRRMLAEHSPAGSAATLRGVQKLRPSLYELKDEISRIDLPMLIMAGDEDEPCLEASLMLKRTVASAALAILPRTGHALNLEEPALFNYLLDDFFHQVVAGRWSPRDPRSLTGRIL